MFKFRPYDEKDYDFVYEVKKIGYQKYVEEYYGAWNDEQQHEMFNDFLAARKDKIQIIVVNETSAGFVDGGIIDAENYEQGNICLLPEFRGKKIGSKILQDLIDEHPTKNISLRVFKSNPAVRLYQRFGFEIVGETKSHFNMIRKAK
jgi:ribosomal protein S18 acetylase RimI-like enzyme